VRCSGGAQVRKKSVGCIYPSYWRYVWV